MYTYPSYIHLQLNSRRLLSACVFFNFLKGFWGCRSMAINVRSTVINGRSTPINVGSTVCLRFVYGPAGIKKKTYDLIRIYRLPQKLSKFSLQNHVFLWSCPWFARGLSMVCPWRGCQLMVDVMQ